MIWRKNIGKLLKYERKSWGMSKKRLARLSHVDIDTIDEIETGFITDPDFYEMLNICEALDSSVFFYMNEDYRKRGYHD